MSTTRSADEIKNNAERSSRPLVIEKWVAAHMSDLVETHARGHIQEFRQSTVCSHTSDSARSPQSKPASAHNPS
jgi:hypothetical protein